MICGLIVKILKFDWANCGLFVNLAQEQIGAFFLYVKMMMWAETEKDGEQILGFGFVGWADDQGFYSLQFVHCVK